MPNGELDATPINVAAVSLIDVWEKMRSKGHFHTGKIAPAIRQLALALIEERDRTELIKKPSDQELKKIALGP